MQSEVVAAKKLLNYKRMHASDILNMLFIYLKYKLDTECSLYKVRYSEYT